MKYQFLSYNIFSNIGLLTLSMLLAGRQRVGKRGRRKLDGRGWDEIEKFAGEMWQILPQFDDSWQRLDEAFVQQWSSNDGLLINH